MAMNNYAKSLMVVLICATFFGGILACAHATEGSLSSEDVTTISNTLQSFEVGQIGLDEMTLYREDEFGHKLITYYLSHSNMVTTKMTLPISRWCAKFDQYPEAIALTQHYVQVYSNDWHAWRILGGADFFMKNLDGALAAYTNAVRLGDNGSYPMLGLVALQLDRLDIVSNMVPRLLVLKQMSKASDKDEALQLATVLLLYSLKTSQEDLFVRAIDGFDPKDILAHDDVTFIVRHGCKEFKGKEIDKLRQIFDAGPKKEKMPITTNSPSS